MAKDDDPVNPFAMRGRRPTQKRKAGRRTHERRPDVRPPPPVRPPTPATPVTPGPQVPAVPGSQVPQVPEPAVPQITPLESVPENVPQESDAEESETPPEADPVTIEQTAELEVDLEVISDVQEISDHDESEIIEVDKGGEEDESGDESPKPQALLPDAVPELIIPQIKEEAGGPPFRRRRQRVKTPSKRTTKLDRRRYMDYKVDLREILEEEEVPEEHRANVLGTTWARGERTGISDAEDYVNEKLAEGVLTDKTAKRIIAVLKRYTTKR